MGYVRTAEEIQRMQALLSPAVFALEGVSVEFDTTEAFVHSVLPPCFELHEPRGLVTTTRWQSAVCGEFESTAVMIFAKFGDLVGTYFLTLVVSGDMPVTLGREMWGEPKKLGSAHFYRDGDDIYAFGERNGTRIAEISATFDTDLGSERSESYALELTGRITHDGRLAGPPEAMAFKVERNFTTVRSGTGALTLTGTPFDPVDEIPIVSVGTALHYTGEATYEQVRCTPLSDGEQFLPYILGRSFDDLTQFHRPARHRDILAPATTRRA